MYRKCRAYLLAVSVVTVTKCLDVTGASTANGALAGLWTCNGQSNQQWTLG